MCTCSASEGREGVGLGGAAALRLWGPPEDPEPSEIKTHRTPLAPIVPKVEQLKVVTYKNNIYV